MRWIGDWCGDENCGMSTRMGGGNRMVMGVGRITDRGDEITVDSPSEVDGI